MKILKRPDYLVFDTDNPDNWYTDFGINHRELTILHHTHYTRHICDWDFLSQYFSPDHFIFDNFSKSYYYPIPDGEQPTSGEQPEPGEGNTPTP